MSAGSCEAYPPDPLDMTLLCITVEKYAREKE